MNDLNKKADLIWMEHHRVDMSATKETIYKHCIESTENTIKVLRETRNRYEVHYDISCITDTINEQTELLTELKTRL